MENQLSKSQSKEVGIVKFKDFNEENPQTQLLQFIDGLCFKLSLPPLEEQQVVYIAKFLVKEFKWASMEDIDNAILKAKANKLQGVNGADYNKLSIDFLGRILNAYRTIKGEKTIAKALLEQKDTLTLPYDNNSPIIAYNHIKSVFLDEKQGGVNSFPEIMLADWTICYNYLINEGRLIEQSLEDKIEFAEMVKEDILFELKEKRADESSFLWKVKMEKGISKYAVALECVKRITKGWFLSNIDKL
tara:strand:- start:3879 stop:4616 length:738 start_codon:yes stop_codon:yes gene_type:complete